MTKQGQWFMLAIGKALGGIMAEDNLKKTGCICHCKGEIVIRTQRVQFGYQGHYHPVIRDVETAFCSHEGCGLLYDVRIIRKRMAALKATSTPQ